jgi:hypothetical protein
MAWLPIETAPVDAWVLLATSGEWVGQAIWGEDEENPFWRWHGGNDPIHANLKPLGWRPLPPPIDNEVEGSLT